MLPLLAVIAMTPMMVITAITWAREAQAARGLWRKVLWTAVLCAGLNYALTLLLTVAH
jgi:hypothetical protein